MKWYSSFITINLLGLAFAYKSSKQFIIMIIFFFIDITALRNCIKMYQYVSEKSDEIHETRKEIWQLILSDVSSGEKKDHYWLIFKMTTPKKLSQHSVISNIIGISLVAIIWFSLIILNL